MDTKKSKTYEINDLISWYECGELNISPKYQRNPVWDEIAKSFLIDTIMRNYPMPPLFFRQTFNLSERKTKREVIDGQQRSRAIIGFYNNEFPILKRHNEVYGGCYFKDLDPTAQEEFLRYNIFVDTITETDDSIIFDIFARMNSNAANVNKQEVRNAKYWGDFKTSVYTVASKVRDFFIDYNIFTSKLLSRMKDMEYISSLFILAMEGCSNETPSKIDKYYKDYDKGFINSQDIETLIYETFVIIRNIFELVDENIIYRNPTYLYDLFGVVFLSKNIFTIESVDVNNLCLAPLSDIATILSNIHYEIIDLKINNDVSPELIAYERMHRVHSTAKVERENRIIYLINRGILK